MKYAAHKFVRSSGVMRMADGGEVGDGEMDVGGVDERE